MAAQKFEFTNYDTKVDIAGNLFTLECTTDTGDYLKKMAQELRTLASEIEEGKKTTADAVEYGLSAIDRLLGENAAERIFEGRKKRLDDIADVCLFLTKVASKFQQQRRNLEENRTQPRKK